MKPIDNIRKGIDSDLLKYHSITVCDIESDLDIKSVAGVGLCAMVRPLNIQNNSEIDPTIDPRETPDKNSHSFPVVIVNRTGRWFEKNISKKYYIMVINIISDKSGMAPGLLIPKSILRDIDVFKNVDFKDTVDQDGVPLQCISKEFIVEDK